MMFKKIAYEGDIFILIASDFFNLKVFMEDMKCGYIL